MAGIPSHSHRDPTRSIFFPGLGPTKGNLAFQLPCKTTSPVFPAAVPTPCSRGRPWHMQEATGAAPRREVTGG